LHQLAAWIDVRRIVVGDDENSQAGLRHGCASPGNCRSPGRPCGCA
jgi:hypothetical protein